MPKRALSVHENEVMRAYKTVRDVLIEPVSFIVPRRSEAFQEDIYPDTLSGEPSLVADDWFSGVDAPLRLLKMETVYQTGSSGHPSRQREFTPVNQSQPETKTIPKIESKAPVQSDTTPKVASTAIAPEKPISSILRTPSEKESTPDRKKDHQIQQLEEPEPEPISKGIEKSTNDNGPSSAAEESNLPSGPGRTASDPEPSLEPISSDTAIQRLLDVVEIQSETIENQSKRIQLLEDQQAQYIKALNKLEARLENMSIKASKGAEEFEDDEGQYVEV